MKSAKLFGDQNKTTHERACALQGEDWDPVTHPEPLPTSQAQQGRAQSSFLYISLSPVLEQSPGALGTHRRMPHLTWDLQEMVRNETKGRRAADPGYSANLAGYAKTFKLEPLGNWGPSDSFAKGRDTKAG